MHFASFSAVVFSVELIVHTGCLLHLIFYCRAAAMSLRTVLLSIQSLLASPEPDDPQDAVVANQLKSCPQAFKRTAQHWAATYANGPYNDPECNALVNKLVLMGFGEVSASRMLFFWLLKQHVIMPCCRIVTRCSRFPLHFR